MAYLDCRYPGKHCILSCLVYFLDQRNKGLPININLWITFQPQKLHSHWLTDSMKACNDMILSCTAEICQRAHQLTFSWSKQEQEPWAYSTLWGNKPKEYPQQPETKTVAKHAMSEVCLLPRPSYSRGRAYKAQSQHKHFMKNRFSKSVRNTVAKIPEARAKAFS